MTGGTFVAHGVTLALAWFAVVNAMLSAAVIVVSRRAATDGAAAPGRWLALRLLPAAGSLAFVALLFVPSYLRFEPRETAEGFDLTLTAMAAAAGVMLLAALVRGVRAWRRAGRQADRWMRGARPLDLCASAVPVYVVSGSRAPLMALVGIRRPRVFVSDRLVAALSAEELQATLAHEASHARAADNLKRLAMCVAPDLLSIARAAATLERVWASAAEHSADRAGAGRDPAARCALASALVKAARLVPAAAPRLEPISTFVGGGDIASRVHQLLGDAPAGRAPRPAAAMAAALLVAASALAFAPLLHTVHAATELLVNSLP